MSRGTRPLPLSSPCRPQRVDEHDRLQVGTKVAIDLLTENICHPSTGLPQHRARVMAVKIRASMAITRAIKRQGLG